MQRYAFRSGVPRVGFELASVQYDRSLAQAVAAQPLNGSGEPLIASSAPVGR